MDVSAIAMPPVRALLDLPELRLLVLVPESRTVAMLRRRLRHAGAVDVLCKPIESVASALALLADAGFDAAIVALQLKDGDVLDAIRALQHSNIALPIIALSADVEDPRWVQRWPPVLTIMSMSTHRMALRS